MWRLDGKHRSRNLAILIFLAPAVAFYVTFLVYPLLQSILMGFFEVKVFGAKTSYNFVGLSNFRQVLDDPVFWRAARNTLTWAAISPFVEIGLGLFLAIALHSMGKRGAFLRVAWFVPVLMPAVVVGILWAWVYNDEWGLLNAILRSMGPLRDLARPWLGDPGTALASLIVATTWQFTGFNMIILLAAVAGIPSDVRDAARIDGATGFKFIWHVVLPLLRPLIINLMILCFVGKMKQFDLVWASTRGGPFWATETVATYTVKRAFHWGTFERGYPSAMVTMWSAIVFLVAVVTNLLLQRRDRIEY